MVVKKIFKIHYIVFFLTLFLSKAIAEPTFVQSYTYPTGAAAHKFNEYGLTFNSDGTKMYTSQHDNECLMVNKVIMLRNIH